VERLFTSVINAAATAFLFLIVLIPYKANGATIDTLPVQTLGGTDFVPVASDSGLILLSSDTNVASIHKGKIHLKKIGATVISAKEGSDSLSRPLWIHSPSSPVVNWGIRGVGKKIQSSLGDSAVAIAANGWHTLALKAAGTVVEDWGVDDITHAATPRGLQHVVAVAAGRLHALALKEDGTVAAWGLNTMGQTNVPQNLRNVLAVAAGNAHSLALRQDGTVVAWGDSSRGQTHVPQNLRNVVAIATGWFHTVALRQDGTVVAWGDSSYGQTRVPDSLSRVVAVVAGSYSSFALRDVGTVMAWGDGGYGQTHVPGSLEGGLAAAAGFAHAAAMTGIRQHITFPPLAEQVYGAADLAPGATATSGLLVEYVSADTSVAVIIEGKIHARSSGTVLITASQAGGGSNLAAASMSRSLTIAPRKLSLAGLKAWDKSYDGTVAARVGLDSLEGVVMGDSVRVVLGGARFIDATVGLNKPVTMDAPTLAGAAAANYQLGAVPSLSASIVASIGTGNSGDVARNTNNNKVLASGMEATTGRLELAVGVPSNFANAAQGGGAYSLAMGAGCFGQGSCLEADVFLPGAAEVTVSIYDNLGTSLITASHSVSAAELAGLEERVDGSRVLPLSWNLRASNGAAAAPGVYLWHLKATTANGQELETTRKMGIRGL